MTIQECYKKMGADYQEVLGRLHNEAMIGKFVRMFLQDDSFQILEDGLRRGDVKEAFRGRIPSRASARIWVFQICTRPPIP